MKNHSPHNRQWLIPALAAAVALSFPSAVSAQFQITSIVRTNVNDLLITWNTAGISNVVQVAGGLGASYPNNFTDLTNVAVTTAITNFLDVGAATNTSARYYRIRQPAYTIGGTISGLTAGDSLVLTNNGNDDLTVTTNGSFTFATPLPYGSTYNVTDNFSSEGAICTVTNGMGTIVTSNITSVVVTCGPIHQCASGYDTTSCEAMEKAGCIAITNGNTVTYDCNDAAYHWLLHVGPNGTGCHLGASYGGNCNSLHALLIETR